jgi:predicted PhzF superfamily epimerase YddE/YHI9
MNASIAPARSATLHVVRVFLAENGSGGNLLGVFLDGRAISQERRQAVAHRLGFSETVYVDAIDGMSATVRIFTPSRELPFAGHPTVGTSWLLRQEGHPTATLHVPAGDVQCRQEGDLAWIRARPEWIHDIKIEQLGSPADVEAIDAADEQSRYVWAWIDEDAGVLRSRYFASAFGIVEDEATGAAAVLMGSLLGRELLIRQGRGSELHVRVNDDGSVGVGGRVANAEVRDFPTA